MKILYVYVFKCSIFFFIFAWHIGQTGRKRLLLHFTTKHGSILSDAVHVLLPKGPWYVCERGNHRNGRRGHDELGLGVRKSSNGIRKRKSSSLLLLLYPLLSKIAAIFSVSFGTINKPLLHVLALLFIITFFRFIGGRLKELNGFFRNKAN